MVAMFYLLKVWLLTNRQQCQNFFSWPRGPDLNKNLFPAGLQLLTATSQRHLAIKTSTTIAHSRVAESAKELLSLSQCQIGTEPVHCKINSRQLLATLLCQAGLTKLTRPQTNKYSVWCWCSRQIKNNKQEIMIVSMHHPRSCGSGKNQANQIDKSANAHMALAVDLGKKQK